MGFVRQITGKEGAARAGEAGALQAGAAERAAEIAAESQREALTEQRRQFGIQREELAPFRELELAGLQRQQAAFERQQGIAAPAQQQLQQLLGLGGQQAQLEAERGVLESPAQQALRERAARLSTRTASAIGGLGGGNIRRELFEQGRGLDLQALQQRRAELAGLSGLGTQGLGIGATGLGAQLGQQQAGNVANLLSGIGATQAGGVTGAAQARASGLLGGQQARAQGTQNLMQLGAIGAGLFSDIRLKENITEIEQMDNGLMLYEWDWTDEAKDIVGDQPSIGFIAHEVKEKYPKAVGSRNGYMTVDYRRILCH